MIYSPTYLKCLILTKFISSNKYPEIYYYLCIQFDANIQWQLSLDIKWKQDLSRLQQRLPYWLRILVTFSLRKFQIFEITDAPILFANMFVTFPNTQVIMATPVTFIAPRYFCFTSLINLKYYFVYLRFFQSFTFTSTFVVLTSIC